MNKSLILHSYIIFQRETTMFSDELAQEIIQLSLVVLSYREHFNIENDAIKKICEIFIVNPDEKTFSHFLETLKDNEFGFFAEALALKTVINLLQISGMNEIINILHTFFIERGFDKWENRVIRQNSRSLANPCKS